MGEKYASWNLRVKHALRMISFEWSKSKIKDVQQGIYEWKCEDRVEKSGFIEDDDSANRGVLTGSTCIISKTT